MQRPHWRQQGDEPDYRFSLANERTFLAWIRTALSLLAAGVLVEQFAPSWRSPVLVAALGLGLAFTAALLCGVAYRRWKANEVAMRHHQPLPGNVAIPLLAAALLVAAAIVAVAMWRL